MGNKRPCPIVAAILAALAGTQAYPSDFRAVVPNSPAGRSFGLSDNGQVIVGDRPSPAPGAREAFRWTPTYGLEWLPFPVSQASDWLGCLARAVNATGSKIFMACQTGVHHVVNWPIDDVKPFVYETGGFTEWPRLHDQSYPQDSTPDGTVVVGYDYEESPTFMQYWRRGVRWQNGNISDLGRLDAGDCGYGADEDSFMVAVSDDGSVIAGVSGELGGYFRPVVSISGTLYKLEDTRPCGPDDSSLVAGISGNGAYVVGHYINSDHDPNYPVYWTISTRAMTILPLFVPGDIHGKAYCTNRDGSLIGGSSGSRGVIWERLSGAPPQLIERVLQAAGLAPKIAGWKFIDVFRISGDGKQMAGRGIHPNGQEWIWWADLRPNPPDNDVCGSAQNITPNHTVLPRHVFTGVYEVTGSTTQAVSDAPHSCASSFEPSVNVWYKYSAPVEGYLYLNLCDTGSLLLDPFIAVHTGCPATESNEIICATDCPELDDCDRPCVMPPALRLNAGQTYYIQVGGGADDQGYPLTLKHQFLPINDDCDDAVQVTTIPSVTPGNTGRMTVDTGAVCDDQPDTVPTAPGVWYKVLGTGTTMTASTCGLADFDTRITVFCSGCGGLTCVGYNNDACGVQSSVSWCAAPGMIYHILVHGYEDEAGPFRLNLSRGRTCTPNVNCNPANEICEEAFPVSEGTTIADNTGANTSTIGTYCAPTSSDVWFTYAPRCDGELWVDTCQIDQGTLVNSVISLYDDCSGSEITCNDNYADQTVDCGLRSAAIASVLQDQEVRIRVAGYGVQPLYQGTFPLRVSEVADPLAVYGGTLPDGFQGQPYETQLQYHGSCGQRFVAANGVPPGLQVHHFGGLVTGVPEVAGDYSIHADVCNNDITNPECAGGDFALRIWPSNDDCADATSLTEGHYFFGNTGATTDGPDEPEACEFSGYTHVENDVWYRYTSSCQGLATVDLCASAYNTKLAVYDGGACPTAPAAWRCNDDECGGLGSLVEFPVEEGFDYVIRIGGYNGAQGSGEMLITCFNDCNGNHQSDTEEIVIGGAPDCNENAHPDECDVRGDFSDDRIINLPDWPSWLVCVTDPCDPSPCEPPLYADPCCGWIDFVQDGDVDLRDLAIFQQAFGSGLDVNE